eukprot:3772171-Prymnesium_polylepis.1
MLPDDLLAVCFAALDSPRSFADASRVCARWRTASRLVRRWDCHIMRCKLERRIERPIVVNQQDLGLCSAAAAHPSGLLYTSHAVWAEAPATPTDSCQLALHVWDLRPHTPVHLHRCDQSDRECSPECCLHTDLHGFLAVAGSQAGRPQIRHALRPPGRP